MSQTAESIAPQGRGPAAPLVMRPAALADVEALYVLAVAAGSGMTNLQPDRELLGARLAASEAALASEDARAEGSPIFFVIAAETGAVVGSALIFPRIGVEWPFYSYRLTRQAQTHRALKKTVAHEMLILANDFDGAAEVGGLFVSPQTRGTAAGRLAARARYLFLAAHRDWFGRQVISEMRGYQDESGASPVWEALGREFYDMDFEAADRLNAQVGNQFISDLAPKHPIYARLMAPAARAALGRPHDDGRRAMTLLLEEGFRYEGYVDIFDGGPTLFADIDDLKAVRDSREAVVARIGETVEGPDHLVCAGQAAAFRCARGGVAVLAEGEVAIEAALAAALGVDVGERVRHVVF